MTQDLAASIDIELRAAGTPERAAKERAYLKSELTHYGASVPAVRDVAKGVRRQHPDLRRDDLVDLAHTLWAEPVHERRLVTVELLDRFGDLLRSDDLAIIEPFLRGAHTWALVDPLAANVAGRLVERDPKATGPVLDRWACDDDFWIRRSALLALLIPLRQGRGDFDRFGRYADAMIEEREFFIRKAIGWVLRDTARKRPGLVFEWFLPRAHRASGVTTREVLKPLSEQQRAAIRAAAQ